MKQTYDNLIKLLFENQDERYKEFHSKLLKNNNIKVIGVRTPKLKEIAKLLTKKDYNNIIKSLKYNYYEESILHGLILGYTNNITNIDNFINKIDNWATCDIACSTLKIYKKTNIKEIIKYTKSNNPWEIRFGLVLILDHQIKKENLKIIFNTCNNITNNHYYVQMAIAWLISICYIKYPEETLEYIKNNKLDTFTHNKTISKICDSYRVTRENKTVIKELRRK